MNRNQSIKPIKVTHRSPLLKTLLKQKARLLPAHSYLSSQLLTVKSGSNPLIAAAASLLSSAQHLAQATTAPPAITNLAAQLQHEVQAFEVQAQRQDYAIETILLARYLLCATLDELIIHSPWSPPDLWEQHSLLQTFYQGSWEEGRSFAIIDYLLTQPKQHLDCLELAYLCLSLGLAGHYQLQAFGHLQLSQFQRQLYDAIRLQQGPLSKQLHLTACQALPRTKSGWLSRLKPSWLILLSLLSLAGIYGLYYYPLQQQLAAIEQQLPTL